MMASSYRSHLPPPPPSSSSSVPFSSSSLLTAAAAVPQQQQLDLDLTIVSAKHLKNVNWRNGELKPYAVFWLDPDRKLATKPDDCGSTRPVWNERFTLPVVSSSLDDSVLNLEIFHSKPSETPKPLVASLRCPLGDLLHPLLLLDEDHHHHHPNHHNHHHNHHHQQRIRTLELHRPSGRPQGKIRLKVSLRERPPPPPPPHDYPPSPHTSPPVPSAYYYSTAPPPPPPSSSSSRDYHHRGVVGGGGLSPSPLRKSPPPHHPSHYSYASYADPYPGYYPGYYSPSLPPPPPRPFFDRSSGYGGPGGPSAPVDFSVTPQAASSSYEQKPKGSMMGFGTGVAVGALAGAMGGLALDEGLKYEEDKITERVERDLASRDGYSDYHAEY